MAPRLLIVVNDATFFLSHRVPIALAARDAGYDVHVAAPRAEASEQIEALGLAFHEIAFSRSGTSPRRELSTAVALARLYRALRPDLVHHVSSKPILYGGFAARLLGVPAVVHAISGLGHVFTAETPRVRMLRPIVLAAYRVAAAHSNAALIFQNDDDRATIGRTRAKLVTVIRGGSGVDLERFRPTPMPVDEPIVMLPARMTWDKGIAELVEAARELASSGVRARFVLVGGGDHENPEAIPEEQLRAWCAEGVVEWWGHRSDMPDVLAQATLVCLPSYREGLPKALVEACAIGRPIVTTDVPGCRDVIGDGTHGVLVPARDARALAAAIRELLSDRARLERMGREASERARRFSSVQVVEQTLEVYRELLR